MQSNVGLLMDIKYGEKKMKQNITSTFGICHGTV